MTDHTSDTPNGVDTGLAEPSMEDILASIRKIIAEDDAADHGHIDANASLQSVQDVVASSGVAELVDVDDVLDLNDVLVLDDAVAETVAEELEIPAIDEDEFNPVSSVVSDLEGKLAENRDEALSLETVLEPDDVVEKAIDLSGVDEDPLADVLEFESGHDEIVNSITEDILDQKDEVDAADALEINLLDDSDEIFQSIEESSEESVAEDIVTALDDDVVETESDLDLVKSLMADLTDTSFLDDDADTLSAVAEEATVEAVSEPAVETAQVMEEVVDSAQEQDEILNDILDMALQDEEIITEDSLELSVEETPLTSAEPGSLLEIAAAAEADAAAELAGEAIEDAPEEADLSSDLVMEDDPSTEELLSELDLALAEVAQDDTSEEDILEIAEVEEPETTAEIEELEDLFVEPEETEDMAQTARKSTIIDEVTETAAASAFAELNQAVEDKAVFTESGPRIGDIVQDALRPMLKEWLDENLKSIVERAVAKEVKRISSGK